MKSPYFVATTISKTDFKKHWSRYEVGRLRPARLNYNFFKSSWIDLNEVDEFILFIEKYVIPNLKDKTERNQSVTYIFNSREITFSFNIEKSARRISIYLKDNGSTDNEHYFWTESQVSKIPELLTMLKEIK